MTADYGQRAAIALDLLVPGPHRDKAVARMFGVSVRTAKYLRTGKRWTVDRMTQARERLGEAFDTALTGAQMRAETENIEQRIARLEAKLEALARRHDAQLAPHETGEPGAPGRSGGPGHRALVEPAATSPADRAGQAPQRAGRGMAPEDREPAEVAGP